MPTMSKLILLPPELIVAVLERLDASSLLACRALCRLLRQIIDETSSLVYTIELEIAGQDDASCQLFAVEKLEKLQNHQAAWNSLQWTKDAEFPMIDGSLWELFGNVLAQRSNEGQFLFRQLPSMLRDIPEKEWSITPDEPRKVRDFGMDPAQDLLILVAPPRRGNLNHKIYCKTMSKGTKHPLVSHSGIIEKVNLFHTSYSVSIQISGDFLSLLYHDHAQNELFVWNWKTGHLELDLTGLAIKSSCFMSERHLVLSVLKTEVQAILSLFIVDFLKESNERKAYTEAQHQYTLCYPTLNRDTHPIHFTIRSDPSPGWVPNQNLGVPFYTSPNNKIFVACLCAIGPEGRHFLFLVIPQKTLLAHQNAMDSENKEVEWNIWGEDTRLLDLCPTTMGFVTWECYVYGSKFVITEANFDDEEDFEVNSSTLLVYDFNQYTLKRALAQGASSMSESDITSVPVSSQDPLHCITSATTLSLDVFNDEVTTGLPYRLGCIPFEPSRAPYAVMCSEDSLIAVDVRTPHNINRAFRVYTF